MSKYIFPFIFGVVMLFSLQMRIYAEESPAKKNFTVVLDAGHGGRDPGAVGLISREKNINLSVALALGKLIENNCPDTRVIYTRKTDVFIPLDRRAQIANKAKADLFISLHTNAMPARKIARGTETYTMGMARAKENLDVAKRENSVILVEDDYQTRYEGFDPKSAESYIIFELMQDKYMEQSVSLAKNIQREFKTTAKRADKGVHQAGFLVLRATSMPSVLVELGYITTPDEERYLNSAQGISQLAQSLYNAFKLYKGKQMRKPAPLLQQNNSTPDKKQMNTAKAKENKIAGHQTEATDKNVNEKETVVHALATTEQNAATTTKTAKQNNIADVMLNQGIQPPVTESAVDIEYDTIKAETKPAADTLLYKIQILTSTRQLHGNSSHFKGLAPVDAYKEGNLYKYTYGNTENYSDIIKLKQDIKEKFPDAFVVAFLNNKKIPLSEARKIKRN